LVPVSTRGNKSVSLRLVLVNFDVVNFGHCWPIQPRMAMGRCHHGLTGSGRMRTLEMSIVCRRGGEDDGGEGRVRRMVRD